MARRSMLIAALAGALLALPAAAYASEPIPCVEGDATPKVGLLQEFDATCTVDPDGHDLVKFEWDLDGDGSFETDTAGNPVATHTYNDRAAYLDTTVDFGVRITDSGGEVVTFRWPLRLTDEINSWFTYAPQLVNPGDKIDLQAFATPETPGAALTYEWDLDGDGTYEHATGTEDGTTAIAPEQLGWHTIGLRISDDTANVSVVRRRIEVLERHPSRDLVPWLAPQNLLQAPPPSDTPPVIEAAVPPAAGGEVEATPAPVAPRREIHLKGVKTRPWGAIVTVQGTPRRRFTLRVSIAPKVARALGYGRRRVIYARGKGRIGAGGIGRVTVRWTKAGRRGFYARKHIVDYLVKLV